jgi:hypothetical protein
MDSLSAGAGWVLTAASCAGEKGAAMAKAQAVKTAKRIFIFN